jgi:hypothetical protein
MMGLEPCATPYQRPESKGMAKSFIKTFKKDYVFLHVLTKRGNGDGNAPPPLEHYNENIPHKGLKIKTPESIGGR